MRQIMDRHGGSPKALVQLRWRVVAEPTPAPPPKSTSAKATGIDRRSPLLAVAAKAERTTDKS